MIKRILVPLDGSELAETVLPYVDRLANALGSEVQLMSVLIGEDPQLQVENYLADRRGSLKGPGNTSIEVSRSESAAQGIIEKAEMLDADLIAMSTHGRSGLARWALGSVADRVIHGTSRPVLLVRSLSKSERRGPTLMNRIIVPLDGSEISKSVLPYIIDLAKPIGGRIALVSVVEPLSAYSPYTASIPQELVNDLKVHAEDFLVSVQVETQEEDLQITTEVRTGSAVDGILKAAEEVGAGMIAMATHGHSGLRRWLMGSVAEGVLRRTRLPCLMVRPGTAKEG